MEPEKGKLRYGPMRKEEIARRIAEAPETFRSELEDLQRRGIILPDGTIDESVRQAFLYAAKKVIAEERAAQAVRQRERLSSTPPQPGVQESSLKTADEKSRIAEEFKFQK